MGKAFQIVGAAELNARDVDLVPIAINSQNCKKLFKKNRYEAVQFWRNASLRPEQLRRRMSARYVVVLVDDLRASLANLYSYRRERSVASEGRLTGARRMMIVSAARACKATCFCLSAASRFSLLQVILNIGESCRRERRSVTSAAL